MSVPEEDDLEHEGLESYDSPNLRKHSATNPLYRWHLEAFQETLYEMLAGTRPETVLDAGCGEGFVTAYLAGRDPDLQLRGIDASSEAIAYARVHFGDRAEFETGSVYDLPYETDRFDAVLCSEVLEHLDRPGEAISELRRVARSHVLITVPLEPYFEWTNRLGRWLGLSPDPGHLQFWTHPEFRAFIEAHLDAARFRRKHVYQLALGGA